MRTLSLIVVVLMLSGTVSAQSRVLGLDEALSLSREHHPALRRARAEREVAEGRRHEVRAGYLPQLLASASYQRTTANFVFRPGAVPAQLAQNRPEPSLDTFNFFSFGATATQLLYDFGQTQGRLRESREQERAQESVERTRMLDTELGVALGFFNARAAKAMLGVAREALDNRERHFARVTAFVELGARPEIDLARLRTELANARVQALTAENSYAIAREALNQAMGIEGKSDYDVADDSLPRLPEEGLAEDALLELAWQRRPEVSVMEALLRAQEHTLSSVRGEYGPTVSAASTIQEAGPSRDRLTWNWNVGVSASWPIVSGGATRARVQQAEARLVALSAERDSLRQQIRLELTRARLLLAAQVEVVKAALIAVESARVTLSLAEGRYEAGVGNIIELDDAQLRLTEAEAQHVRAEYDLSAARAAFRRALGSET